MSRTGREALIEQLRADGVRYIFGNPGTVEQGFLDALEKAEDIEYILALQEAVVVGIADGYARATRKPTVVQLHSGVGLGNGIGMLYQAMRGHAPLVVLAGDAGVQYDAMEAQMAADLVGMARPVTKWATRVTHPTSLLRTIRRAVKVATTPPYGPVFVALPADVLDAPNTEEVRPSIHLHTRVAPSAEEITRIAELLIDGEAPLIVMGDGVTFAGAQPELQRVAQLLGAQVWGADSSEVNFAADLPQFGGLTGHMFGYHSEPIMKAADRVLVTGTYLLPEVYPTLENIFAPDAKVVHIDLDHDAIAKNHPVDLAYLADPKPTLALLADELERLMTPQQRAAAEVRNARLREQAEKRRAEEEARDASYHDQLPLHASLFAQEVAARMGSDVIIFDEAITTSPEIVRYLQPTQPGRYFQTRGGSLGVGIPGALGVKLAYPDSPVVAFVGDGGSMYTIQALWTAVRHHIDATFVICNNGGYEILKQNIQEWMKWVELPPHDYPKSFDLAVPPIHFTLLAESMGVPGIRVEKPEDIAPAVNRMVEHRGPLLIDLVIANRVRDLRDIAGAAKA